jgi:hypothetical protein
LQPLAAFLICSPEKGCIIANSNLTSAKKAKNDEFYTRYEDIEKEIQAYVDFNPDVFKGKAIYCNCDDPFESNFFKFFANKFNEYGIKKLITTSYAGSSIAHTQTNINLKNNDTKGTVNISKKPYRIEINEVADLNKDGITNLEDIKWLLEHDKNICTVLRGNDNFEAGDFRSQECIELLKEADIVVTNPPFSLFRSYIKQLITYNRRFLIIGNMNAITYKEVFPLIKGNKVWLGVNNGARTYIKPDKTEHKMGNTCWFTNLDHGRRHQPLQLMTTADNLRFNKKFKYKEAYIFYENYDAIEVPFTDAIPSDYDGMMGVPISFLDKYNPDQFEILGTNDNGLVDNRYKKTQGLSKKFVDDYYIAGGTGAYKAGNPTAGYYENNIAKMAYKRIFIRHKKGAKK